MSKCTLVPHNLQYAENISKLSSSPYVKNALGLTDDQTSIEGTKEFILFIQEEEKLGKQFSRVILNRDEEVIGVITLKDIDLDENTSHIGTWIGHTYWGQGYNEAAKEQILYTAFTKLGLHYVFAGAKLENVRSQKAQEKLPYIRIGVNHEFPTEYEKLYSQVKAPCILNVIEKETFLGWYPK